MEEGCGMSYSTLCCVIWTGLRALHVKTDELTMREGADLVLKLVVMRID